VHQVAERRTQGVEDPLQARHLDPPDEREQLVDLHGGAIGDGDAVDAAGAGRLVEPAAAAGGQGPET
jgi:hypothetical protein